MSDGFEPWLRQVCFQKPTPEAYDLAKDAWAAGREFAKGDTVMAPGTCAIDSPWPLRDVVAKLVEATDILLDQKSYDGHGHESVRYASNAAKEWLKQPH